MELKRFGYSDEIRLKWSFGSNERNRVKKT